MSNDIDKSVNRLNAAETIRRQAIALQKHISEALAGLQTLSGSEDIQISHALTMATVQASKALKQAHLMQDSATCSIKPTSETRRTTSAACSSARLPSKANKKRGPAKPAEPPRNQPPF